MKKVLFVFLAFVTAQLSAPAEEMLLEVIDEETPTTPSPSPFRFNQGGSTRSSSSPYSNSPAQSIAIANLEEQIFSLQSQVTALKDQLLKQASFANYQIQLLANKAKSSIEDSRIQALEVQIEALKKEVLKNAYRVQKLMS